MTRVLVTGASGFIGRRTVAALLDQGFEVDAVARHAPSGAPEAVRWHEADLLDRGARTALVAGAQATHLLHLAWYAEPGRYWSSTANTRWVSATADLIERFAAQGGARAVVAGTCAEYEWGQAAPCTEGVTPLRPVSLYGICKDATRRIAEGLAAQLEVSLAWGRIFFVYGPGEHPSRLVASVARALVAGERAAIGDGTQRRDFMHVDDVARALSALLAGDVQGAVNVGSGEAVAIDEVARLIAAAAGGEHLLDVGALPERSGQPASVVAHPGRLREEIGFAPSIPLETGVADTVRWWRERR